MKRIAIVGSTGSIGVQTLDVAAQLPDEIAVVAIAADKSFEALYIQAAEYRIPSVTLYRTELSADALRIKPSDVEVTFGSEALEAMVSSPGVDMVVIATTGFVGARACLAALNAGKDVALATKEVLVSAGGPVMAAAKQSGARVLPIDSEHSAILQCMQGQPQHLVSKIWITASGGPFREWTLDRMVHASPDEALKHPTWNMGRKISIDSATLMNKGLETIEAQWLFGLAIEQINVVVHPQSIVHSFVEMIDGSFLAQLGVADMRVPISYALLYPERKPLSGPKLDPCAMSDLTFEAPDMARFPCLTLARDAAHTGGTMPAVMNAANEASVVNLFLEGRIGFMDIPTAIEKCMRAHVVNPSPTIDDIVAADEWARSYCLSAIAA